MNQSYNTHGAGPRHSHYEDHHSHRHSSLHAQQSHSSHGHRDRSREHLNRHSSISSTSSSLHPTDRNTNSSAYTSRPKSPLPSPRKIRRPAWPPPPFVEPEVVSIKKEANPLKPVNDHFVPLRGSRSQSPVIQGPMIWDTESSSLVDSSDPVYQARHLPKKKVTPLSENASKANIKMAVPGLSRPGMEKRKPSYKGAPTDPATKTQDELLREKRRAAFIKQCTSDALRGDGKPRSNSKSSAQQNHASLQNDPFNIPKSSDAESNSQRHATPYHMNASELHHQMPRHFHQNSSDGSGAPLRQSSDSSQTLKDSSPTSQRTERPPPLRPLAPSRAGTDSRSPVVTPSSRTSAAADYMSFSRASSRPASPTSGRVTHSSTSRGSDEESLNNRTPPPAASRPVSRDGSRASSPRFEDGPRRSSTFPIVAPISTSDDRAAKRSSKLASSPILSNTEVASPTSINPRSSLPYPVAHDEASLVMPSEVDHISGNKYFDAPFLSHAVLDRESQNLSSHSSRQSSIASDLPMRPRLEKRHTADLSMPAMPSMTPLSAAGGYIPSFASSKTSSANSSSGNM